MTDGGLRQQNSPVPEKGALIRLVAFNARYTHSCLALFYIRNELLCYLPQARVEIVQLTINDNDYESLLTIADGVPSCVFFSAAIWNSDKVAWLVADLRGVLPECRIVVGGPEAGVLRGRLDPGLCTFVFGEIEAIDGSFYHHLLSGNLQPCYQGRFLGLPDKRLGFPYREDDFGDQLHNRHIYYESSRGCPYNCSYCLSATEQGVYHKPLDQVQEELAGILNHRPKVVRFIDRTFNDRPQRALAIWRFLLEEKCDTLFHFEIAPERFTEEMFAFLATVPSGRMQFEIGIQSTHRPTLEAIRRRLDIDGVAPIISRLAALGTIHLHVDLILGLPYETAETFLQSFRDVFAMGAHYIQMGLLKMLPDTPICHGADEYGYVHATHPPYPVFANRWLDHASLRELYWFSETVEKFHNNRYFISLWNYLRTTGEDITAFFQALCEAGKEVDLHHRAATQELLCELLVTVCRRRPDREVVEDLLRYDWLRCGFRGLPEKLTQEMGELPEETRDMLHRDLPAEIAGLFDAHSRNRFFKRGVFWRMGSRAAEVLGLGDGVGGLRLVVVQEREATIHRHNRVLVLARGDWKES